MKTPLLVLTFLPMALAAQSTDATQPPANAKVVATAVGHGVQIYRCDPQGSDFKWVLQGPDAILSDPASKQPVGTHSVGPTWHWNDGSEIQGKLIQSQPSPNPQTVPWLLLQTHSTGSDGVLAKVTLVRRSDTQAGAAPELGCRAMYAGNLVRVPYEALYTFYSTE